MKHNQFTFAAAAAFLTSGVSLAIQDECTGADTVLSGVSVPFDTTGATLSAEAWSCATNGGPDLWWVFTASTDNGARISTCGSTYDTALTVYEGTCGALVEIECNDDFCGTQSQIDIPTVTGGVYYVRVGGWDGSVGVGTLNVNDFGIVAGDECFDALPAAPGGNAYDTTTASPSTQAWTCAGSSHTGGDLWYSYTPPVTGVFTVDTEGSMYDTALMLFDGPCGDLNVLACDDDGGTGLLSSISFCGLAGTEYTIRVGGFNSSQGVGSLNLSEAAAASASVTTLFAANNGGSVGGGAYFDVTATQAVEISRIATNTSVAAGTPITADLYTNPAGWVGTTGSTAGWTLVATGVGVSAGENNPSELTLTPALSLAAGTVGVAVHAVDFNHRYTNGTGVNETAVSGDGILTLSLGGGSNVLLTGNTFAPRVWNGTLFRNVEIGTKYCGPAVANSTGLPADLTMGGSAAAADDSIVLVATNLPPNSFTYFLASDTQGLSMPGSSMGNLCLDGMIGRGVGGQVYNSGETGVICATSTLTLPTPMSGTVTVTAGDTYNFQGWYRDAVGGMATSNLTNAVSVTFN